MTLILMLAISFSATVATAKSGSGPSYPPPPSATGSKSTISNFIEVSPGIYRGGSPSTSDLVYLSDIGVRTIISLQGDIMLPIPSERSSARKEAAKISAQLGMRHHNFPTPAMLDLTSSQREQIKKAAAIMANPGARPVFVHCSLGDDRTGLAIAVYRVLYEGWTADRAYDEMTMTGHSGLQALFTDSLRRSFYRIIEE